MDQALRNKLRSVVTQCRRLLEESIAQQLQGKYDIYATGKKDEVRAEKDVSLGHLTDEERQARQDILAHFEHIQALDSRPKEALEQLIREIAFTHLNRLCAYKMMEVRDVYVGGQRFREAVSKGLKSQGFLFYLADHPEDERRYNAGEQEVAYRHFLNWLGGTLSQEIGVLFSPTDPANRVYPPQRVLDGVLDLLNSEELKGIWSEDETIGWVYQYFTPKELRDQARKESQAPRNSYELAFRNQFFTPRYVVEFLTDNSLGRIWYEMRKGETRLKDVCRYMVRRPDEVFLADFTNGSVEESTPPPDLEFLLGKRDDLAPFELPNPVVHPLLMKEPGVIEAGWVESDEAGDRLWAFAHYVRSFAWGSNPRIPELRQRLEEWNTGSPDDPVEGMTQDLWDIFLAVHRAERFGAGDVAPHGIALTRIANEIRRRLLASRGESATQQELLLAPALIPHRPKKDPREIKILDPACGSGHFLLYCFALLLAIYEEAYEDTDLGTELQAAYPTKADLRRAVPDLILRHNLHGIDIDLRCSQIAALALWLRCQRAYQEVGINKDRPHITKSNIVCAEPMPGEGYMLKEFVTQIEPKLLGQLVEVVFDKMKLAGEAGSLLKIDEEIRDTVAQARKQWFNGPVSIQQSLFDDEEPAVQQQRFDLSGITETQFFEQAEVKVTDALRNYAENAQNGHRLQRRLFAEDAVRGFAFLDVCHKRYDEVLMNPPFGAYPSNADKYLSTAYPKCRGDLYPAFVTRFANLATFVGAITNRTGLMLTGLAPWRRESLLGKSRLQVLSDLGIGVLDALVETALYIIGYDKTPTVFLDCLAVPASNLEEFILANVAALRNGIPERSLFTRPLESFLAIPDQPIAFRAPESIVQCFERHPPTESGDFIVRITSPNYDDFRFFRLRWEVPAQELGRKKRWSPIVKGGEYEPYFADLPMVVDWDDETCTFRGFTGSIHRPLTRPACADLFFNEGITWAERTASRFSPRILPSGAIFGNRGPFAGGGSRIDTLWHLGMLMSAPYQALLELFVAAGDATSSGSAARDYQVGYVRKIPLPILCQRHQQTVAEYVRQAVSLLRLRSSSDETSSHFVMSVHCLAAY